MDSCICSSRDAGNITQKGLSAMGAAGADKGNLALGTRVWREEKAQLSFHVTKADR